MKHLKSFLNYALIIAVVALVVVMVVGLGWLMLNCQSGCTIYLGTQPRVQEVRVQPKSYLSSLIVHETVRDEWEAISSYHVTEDIHEQVLSVSGMRVVHGLSDLRWQATKYYRLPNRSCGSGAGSLFFNAQKRAEKGQGETIFVWVSDGVISGLQTAGGEGADGCQK